MKARIAIATVASLAMVAACGGKTPEPRTETNTPPVPVTMKGNATGEATLMLMADIRGVLRPCGCTVELQKGGFDRLVPYLASAREEFPNASLMHAGPMFFEEAKVDKKKAAQRVRQAEVTADFVGTTRIDVAGVTAVDVAAAKGKLDTLVTKAKLRVTAANLEVAGTDVQPWQVKQVGGLKVGVFALASPEHAAELGELGKVSDPKQAAEQAIRDLSSRADVIVLLSALGLRNTKRLVRKVQGIHFAVVGGLGEYPDFSDEAEDVGGTRVMQFHREGRYLGRLTLKMVNGQVDFVDASTASETEIAQMDARIGVLETKLKGWEKKLTDKDKQVRDAKHQLASLKTDRDKRAKKVVDVPPGKSSFSFTLVPLNWDLPQDETLVQLMKAFDEEVKQINLANAGTLPEPKPGEAVYVGVDTCLECHDEAETYWKHDRHGKAWATLEKDGKTFDAECVSCHVTGYGKAGGSLVGQTKDRENVQCEACHGPGSKHAEDGDIAFIDKAPREKNCVGCHNKHHSPNFHFGRYRQKLMVPGHGLPLN